MKASEKRELYRNLDLIAAYAGGGFRRNGEIPDFADDAGGSPAFPEASSAALPQDEGESAESIDGIALRVRSCAACGLCSTRRNAVPGEGVPRPLVMVIGEGPGADEDASGRPFVGRAGQLLDRMLASVGLDRTKNCFIANIVKCRPPGNRDPEPAEVAACTPFLAAQIEALRPRMILCAGRHSSRFILNTSEGITRLRGRFGAYFLADGGEIPVLPTYHPSALLRDETLKAPAFSDLKMLLARLAAMDSAFAAETLDKIRAYAAKDPVFAAQVEEFLA